MGKTGDKRRKAIKMKKRRTRKAEKQRIIDSRIASGTNTKSRRWRLKVGRGAKGLSIRSTSAKNIADIAHHQALNLPFLTKTYLMHKAGIANQWTARNTEVVRAFVKKYRLSWSGGRVIQDLYMGLTDDMLFKLAREFAS